MEAETVKQKWGNSGMGGAMTKSVIESPATSRMGRGSSHTLSM